MLYEIISLFLGSLARSLAGVVSHTPPPPVKGGGTAIVTPKIGFFSDFFDFSFGFSVLLECIEIEYYFGFA